MSNFALKGDAKDWARKIMARLEYGQTVGIYAAWCARQALGIPEPEPAQRIRTRRAAQVPAYQAQRSEQEHEFA